MRIARRLRRARRTLVVLGLFAVVTAVVAVAAPAAGAATTCSNVFTTHSTISSAPKIVVDVYGSGRATHDPAGVALGDYQLTIDQSYGNSGWNSVQRSRQLSLDARRVVAGRPVRHLGSARRRRTPVP